MKRLFTILAFIFVCTMSALAQGPGGSGPGPNTNLASGLVKYAADPFSCNSTKKGRQYFNTVSNVAKVCDGSAWQTVATGSAGLADPGGNGIVVRTSANVTTNRSVVGTSPITATNGDGVSGNPTMACLTCGVTGSGLNQFASTTSAQFLGVIGNETGGGLVMGNDTPTILTPTVASFINANHNHQNAAGGGSLDAAAIGAGTLGSARGGTGSAFFGIAGPTALRSYTFPDANATIARTDAANVFQGGQLISNGASSAFIVGPNGSTNPVLQVDASVASQAAGLKVTGNASGSGVTLSVISSGSNEDITLTPKGTGAVKLGNITFTNPASAITVVTPKRYVALLTQTGTSAPVATVLENTLSGTPVWSYDSEGTYHATLSGAFPTASKTTVVISSIFVNALVAAKRVDANTINLDVVDADGMVAADFFLSNANGGTTIIITVYP